ncbi:alpha/beta hydrolase family protein [Geomonas azotofigens]|uniref:Mbeg1-like protein n=1 Tax=Geomonas azotofigens TaxID=2843196 RepID=UPI001C12602B|nr:Mbeg1-like protein [Geomonas azotofigens]MBU5613345.1 DUF2974 domain-containing protein [Geomonas azotofigens]
MAHAISEAKKQAAKRLFPQPAGAAIVPCPKNGKAQRVAERKAKLAASKARLKRMPPGRQRDALAQATARFERNNIAVERARLADDAYKVGQGEPPEGWERVAPEELRKLGMSAEDFPQVDPKFRPSEHKDGYYAELYRAKPDVFGQEQYVVSFRGTQGIKDGVADVLQAFGGETDHYSRAMKAAKKLKKSLGGKIDFTGHSMGGGMATAAGIVSDSKVFAIDPAGVHPKTLERIRLSDVRGASPCKVETFVAEGEILDSIQAPGFQRFALAGVASVTPVGGCAMAIAGRRAMVEKGTVTFPAAGPIHKVPILVNAKEALDGKTSHGIAPGLGGRTANAMNPIRKVKLHDPLFVIAGMEQQKADDIAVIKGSIL